MRQTPSYTTRREAVKVIGLVAISALTGVTAMPEQAQAAGKSYKIIYKLNGGQNPASQVKKIKKGAKRKVSKLKKPTRTGYSFVAWYTDKKLTKKAKKVYGKKKKAKRRLYAKWKLITYKINYVLNGGTAPVTLPDTHTVTSPTIYLVGAQRAAHSFGGWYADKEFKAGVPQVPANTAGNLTLHAKWNDANVIWANHLEQKRNEIIALRDERVAASGSEHVEQFFFITDTHLHSSAMYAPEMLRYLAEQTGISRTVYGGDAIGLSSTADEAYRILQYTCESLTPPGGELLFVRGNHDNNDQGSTAAALTDAQFSGATGVIANRQAGGMMCFCRDLAEKQIRYIILDTGHPGSYEYKTTDPQARWFQDRITELDEGWTVLVFQHQFFQTLSGSYTPKAPALDPNGKATIPLINEVYDQAREKGIAIAGVLSGHGHYDYAEQPAMEYAGRAERFWKGFEYPYWCIATTCDAVDKAPSRDPAASQRKRGTLGEQAFDVVTLDTQAQELYFMRVGLGTQRGPFSYAPVTAEDPEASV